MELFYTQKLKNRGRELFNIITESGSFFFLFYITNWIEMDYFIILADSLLLLDAIKKFYIFFYIYISYKDIKEMLLMNRSKKLKKLMVVKKDNGLDPSLAALKKI